MKSFPQGSQIAFSLVEVVMAMGICVFVLMAVVGLLPLCLQSASESIDLTRQSAVIQAVSAQLERVGFAELKANGPRSWTFDADGIQTDDSAAIHYRVSATAQQGVLLPGCVTPSTNLLLFNLEIETPSTKRQTTLTISDMGN